MDNKLFVENGHYIDRKEKKIYVTHDFNNKASIFGSQEAELFDKIQEKYPDFECVVKTPRSTGGTLTWALMFKTAESEKNEELLDKLRSLKDGKGGLSAYHEAKDHYKTTLNRNERNQKVKDESNTKPKAKTAKKATATEEVTTETAE